MVTQNTRLLARAEPETDTLQFVAADSCGALEGEQ